MTNSVKLPVSAKVSYGLADIGINVFVMIRILKDVHLSQISIGVLPFCVALWAMIVIVVIVPQIVL